MALHTFRTTAQYLVIPQLDGVPIRLRIEGDSDDPNTWHLVKTISDQGFRTDTSQSFITAITIKFHDETPEMMFNDTDQIEIAIPPPPT
ncbi:hypothetical protein [Mycobacterium sp. M23085]|uniref:hypothetical protein n=1 Tax=Mycobacterium sp. M23085 TaxID=3378087 RepID=UPI0038780110